MRGTGNVILTLLEFHCHADGDVVTCNLIKKLYGAGKKCGIKFNKKYKKNSLKNFDLKFSGTYFGVMGLRND